MVNHPQHTVLVADDDELLRKGLCFLLRRAGLHVLDAPDSQSAYELLRNNHVDLVLSDMRMPGGGGLGLLTRVKQHDPALPIIMFVTATGDITPEEAFHRGAAAIFSKPFDRELLMLHVKRCLHLCSPLTPHSVVPPLKLEGHIGNGKLGRGGFSFFYQGDAPVATNRECAFHLTVPVLNTPLEGKGLVRWQHAANGGHWLGVEATQLQTPSQNSHKEWCDRFRPIPHIPFKEG